MGFFDASCPYCGEEQEINHDDGYGYDEDQIFHQSCSDCDKVFTFRTSIIFSYDTAKADCLNGASHNFEPTFTRPVEYTKMRCTECGEERPPTASELNSIIKTTKLLTV